MVTFDDHDTVDNIVIQAFLNKRCRLLLGHREAVGDRQLYGSWRSFGHGGHLGGRGGSGGGGAGAGGGSRGGCRGGSVVTMALETVAALEVVLVGAEEVWWWIRIWRPKW